MNEKFIGASLAPKLDLQFISLNTEATEAEKIILKKTYNSLISPRFCSCFLNIYGSSTIFRKCWKAGIFLSLSWFYAIFTDLFLFLICLTPEFLPASGPLTRWCASTLGAALLCSSRAGSWLGAYIVHKQELNPGRPTTD